MNYKEYNQKDVGVPETLQGEIPLHAKLGIEQIVYRHILETLKSASEDESIFAANVRSLLSLVPPNKKQEILDRHDEYESIDEHWEFKKLCGVNMNPSNDPTLREQLGSPYKITIPNTDWHELFGIICEAFYELGVTWKQDVFNVEIKRVKDDTSVEPTPVFDGYVAEPDEPTESGKRPQKCAYCREPVAEGKGDRHTYHTLIHKDHLTAYGEQLNAELQKKENPPKPKTPEWEAYVRNYAKQHQR